MALSSRTVRISGALLISALFIAFGWFFSPSLSVRLANANSMQATLQAYATKDSDNDGLPDWKESLYGTDPGNPHSVDPALTDGEAVAQGKVTPKFSSDASSTPGGTASDDNVFTVPAPAAGSVTEQVAQSFLQDYMDAGAPGVGTNTDGGAVVASLVSQLSAKVDGTLGTTYAAADFKSSPNMSVTAYVSAVEGVMKAHEGEEGTNELSSLIDRMVNQNDASARPGLLALSKFYAGMAADLVKITAPTSLASAHETLVRSFDRAAGATKLVADFETDPLATAAALAVFKPTIEDASSAIETIVAAVRAQNGEPAPGAPGSYLIFVLGSGLTTQ